MIGFVGESFWPSILFAAILYVIYEWLCKELILGPFDGFTLTNISVASSGGLLFAFYNLNLVKFDQALQIIILYTTFYLGVAAIGKSNKNLIKKYTKLGNFSIQDVFAVDNLTENYLVITGFISLLLSLLFTAILFLSGGGGDDRIGFYKSFRSLSLVSNACQLIFIPTSIAYCIVNKKNKNKNKNKIFPLLILNLSVLLFSGSKSGLIPIISYASTMASVIFGKDKAVENIKKYWLLILMLLLTPILATSYAKGSSINDSINSLLDRIYSSGDLYYYSFVVGDYTDLYKSYNFFSYLLHPFTSLIGIRGYDFPIGSKLFYFAQLAQSPNTEEMGFGPNPQLPILYLVLLHGNFLLSVISCFFSGLLVGYSKVYAIRNLYESLREPYVRIFNFCLFYFSSSTVILDLAAFQFNLVGVFFLSIVISFHYKVMRFNPFK